MMADKAFFIDAPGIGLNFLGLCRVNCNFQRGFN
jgi:hypothetical protein